MVDSITRYAKKAKSRAEAIVAPFAVLDAYAYPLEFFFYDSGGYIKIIDGDMHTPLIAYKREGSPEINVIGTWHSGEGDYYRRLQKEIDGCERGLYEIMVASEEDQRRHMNLAKYYLCANNLKLANDKFSEYLGLTRQTKHTSYQKGWKNSDSTWGELLEKFSRGFLERFVYYPEYFQALDDLYKKHPCELSRVIEKAVLTFHENPKLAIGLAKKLGKSIYPLEKEAIIDFRNGFLYRGVQQEIKSGKGGQLGIEYGACHLSGLDKFLKDIGYQKESTEWIRVWKSRNKPALAKSLATVYKDICEMQS